MPKKFSKKPTTSFQKKVVKEDKSSFPPFAAARVRAVKEDKSSFPPFAAARVRAVKEDKSSFPPFAAARVYEVVKEIPRGKVMSYRAVAKLAGSPRAFRAVGNILNKNRDPKIPCHRIVRSDGRIGGYNNGTKKKIALLKKEGIIIYHGKVAS